MYLGSVVGQRGPVWAGIAVHLQDQTQNSRLQKGEVLHQDVSCQITPELQPFSKHRGSLELSVFDVCNSHNACAVL